MNTAEKIFEEVRVLPEVQAREVLDFVGYLKTRLPMQPKGKLADIRAPLKILSSPKCKG